MMDLVLVPVLHFSFFKGLSSLPDKTPDCVLEYFTFFQTIEKTGVFLAL